MCLLLEASRRSDLNYPVNCSDLAITIAHLRQVVLAIISKMILIRKLVL